MVKQKHILTLLIAALVAVPGIVVRLAHIPLDPPLLALVSGAAIIGASFLLLWACDAAQSDISQAMALAVVAFIAVLPEYAVDMYFTWQAGKFPQSNYAHFAVANMTGANRLLIGVAWATIAVLFWLKTRQAVRIEDDRRTELFFLALATVYAFVVPLKGTLTWVDGVVFLAIYLWYIILASRRPCTEEAVEGPAELLVNLPMARRRQATALLFLYSAGAILANAEPFCEGLIGTGKVLGVNEFLLVQWLAPIASEAPEFVLAIMFTLRRQAGLALGSLLSAKLNQWTLLVGMIPGVFAASSGSLQHPIPMSGFQMHEILLTAAQSLLGVVILATLRLTIGQALLLFGLFIGQLLAPTLVNLFPGRDIIGVHGNQMHQLFSLLYLIAAVSLLLDRPGRLKNLWAGMRCEPATAEHEDTPAKLTHV